jgi:hypothetical protein
MITQPPPLPPVGTPTNDQERTPLSEGGPARFDHALSAVIDHLMQIEDFQLAIDAELLVVKSLVEELLP